MVEVMIVGVMMVGHAGLQMMVIDDDQWLLILIIDCYITNDNFSDCL